MNERKIYQENQIAACYFRTAAQYPAKKCLIQITERCNLRCKHCFVSAGKEGSDMNYETIRKCILPVIKKNNITKVTLTGGEPLVYPHLSELVNELSKCGITVGICSNGVLINKGLLESIKTCEGVHFNISLDGFSAKTHGRFRGNEDPAVFKRIQDNIGLLRNYHMLKGILVTPNIYTPLEEYEEICKFAKSMCAEYVLMNPLSEFGRGEDNIKLRLETSRLIELRERTKCYNDKDFQMVYIRFPQVKALPVSKCHAGEILYIFTNGNIAYCPYMAFAANDKASIYDTDQFIVGNCFEEHFDWEIALKQYTLPCANRDSNSRINNREGCFAIKIANGLCLGDEDPICNTCL